MKDYISLLIMVLLLAPSCSSNSDELLNMNTESEIQNLLETRSVDNPDSCDSLVEDIATEEMLLLKEKLENMGKAMRAPITPSTNADDASYFSSNIYAIRELPINFKWYSSDNYLSCSGRGKEVILEEGNRDRSNHRKFKLKVLPASAGIPYLIYSYLSGTPITVGHYTSDPSIKILMSQNDNSKVSDMAGWDLIPSSLHKGFFRIQNNLYLGQEDPNIMGSIFYYTLEANNDKKIIFSKPNSSNYNQEFKINTCKPFSLTSIEYDITSANISKEFDPVPGSGVNLSSQPQAITISYKIPRTESSWYNTTNNILQIDVTPINVIHPWVIGGNIQIPTPATRSNEIMVPFQPTKYSYTRDLSYNLNLNCPARNNVYVTVNFVKYTVSIKFLATAIYEIVDASGRVTDTRELKIPGTWIGTIYEDPADIAPTTTNPVFKPIGGGPVIDPDEPIIIP